MNLYDIFFNENRRSAALVGGGGKTTLMAGIARDAATLNQPLVVSTSTKLQRPCPIPRMTLHESSSPPEESGCSAESHPVLWVGTKTPAGDKWIGPPIENIESFISHSDSSGKPAVLVEADGAAGRPIKAPGPDEPVIPRGTATVAALMGFSALGRPVSEESVHRLIPFLKITGASPGDIISPEMLIRLILHPEGSFKGCDSEMRRLLIINQADSPRDVLDAEKIAEMAMDAASKEALKIDMAIVSALRNDYRIWSIIGP